MTHDPRDVECAREAYDKSGVLAGHLTIAILAAKLARERAENGGVDPKVLRARELLAVEAERRSDRWLAGMYRTGAADDTLSFRAVLAALSEGEKGSVGSRPDGRTPSPSLAGLDATPSEGAE